MSALSELLLEIVDHQLQKVELGFIAKIVTFDKVTMRAEIRPLLRSITEENGKDAPDLLDMPNLDEVPVELIYAGGFYIRPVYKSGDLVKCSCTASSIEPPIDEGQRSNMLDARFSLSYITVTGGVVPKQFTPPASWGAKEGLLIGNGDDTILEVKPDGFEFTGDVAIKGDLAVDGKIEATGDIVATGDVKAGPLGVSLLTHTHAVVALGSPTGPPLP